MNKYDRFYEESCREAREVVNGWMNDKLRSELSDDPVDSHHGDMWHEDSDAFLQSYLTRQNIGSTSRSNLTPEVDLYADDESTTVDHLMKNMQAKLSSTNLFDYELKEKKKKGVQVKDPRVAMELRQRKVKQARLQRDEEMKKKLTTKMQKKQSDAIAKQIVKHEVLERSRKERMEEEAIQREMENIRKRMADLKKHHSNAVKPITTSGTVADSQSTALTTDLPTKNPSQNLESPSQPCPKSSFQQVHNSSSIQEQESRRHEIVKENVHKFANHQRQKLLRNCFQKWIKVILSQRASMGKAKALSDWHLVLKTWSSWRRYCLEQVAQRDAEIYQNDVKQMKIHDHLAKNKHRVHLLKKYFINWKKFVKMEQYSKELMKEQEETKRKMAALLGAVTTQATSNNDLVLQTIEDDDVIETQYQPQSHSSNQRKAKPLSHERINKENPPKQVWQVRRTDVKKLTIEQIGDMQKHGEVTKVKSVQSEIAPNSHNNRYKASKQMIVQQRQMITEQKQIIDEQRRMLAEKDNTPREVHEATQGQDVNEKPHKVVLIQTPKRPKSLLAMEKRAEERLKRKEDIQIKRREAERAKVEEMQREEDERLKREEEEKKERIKELKRIKQLKEEKENERKLFIARMQQLRLVAEKHYEKVILQKYGLRPWKLLMRNQESKMQIAQFHYGMTVFRKVLTEWHVVVVRMKAEKEDRATRFYDQLLVKRYFGNWLKYGETMTILERKAEIHSNRNLKLKYMKKWERYVTGEQLAYFDKEEMAASHNLLRMKRRVFTIIRVHKQNVKRDETRHARIADMRRKVAQLLPDFNLDSSDTA